VDDRTRDDQKEEPRERRGPRPSSESVRIIGADEAAAAIEAGQAAGRRPDDAPRFGDVPAAPEGPRPPLRFPMPGADPSSVAKPPIVGTPADPDDLADEDYLEGLMPAPGDEPEAWAAEPEAWPTEPETWTAEEDDWGVEPEPPATPSPSPSPSTDPPTLVTPARGVELPHWTEPGTGEVPAILGETESEAGEPEEEEELAWSAFSAAPRWRDQPSDWEEPDFDAAAALADDETRVGALDTGQTDYSDIYSFDEPEPAPPPVQEAPPEPTPPPAPAPTVIGSAPSPYEPVAEAPVQPPQRDVGVAIGAGLLLGAAVLIAAKIGAAAVLILVTAV